MKHKILFINKMWIKVSIVFKFRIHNSIFMRVYGYNGRCKYIMGDRISVLIADDNIEFGNLLNEYMSQYEDIKVVGVARDGLQAVEMIKLLMPDIVILDIIMPNLDGIGVLEKMSKAQMDPKPMIIVLSAIGQDVFIQKAISLGAEYYIVKPFDADILVLRMRQVYNEKYTTHFTYKKYFHIDSSLRDIKNMSREKALEVEVTRILRTIGIPPHMSGYQYLRYAIMQTLKTTAKGNNSVTKVIYPAVAEEFDTTPQKVERAIRNAIESAWQRGNPEAFNVLYGCRMNFSRGRPTNSQFIAMVSDRLRIKK